LGEITVSKILIVDDSQDIRELMTFVFEGYEVVTASNGQDALDKLTSQTLPGLIILDHDMDIMNGPTFVTEFKRIYPGSLIPIILLTGRELNEISSVYTSKAFKKPLDIHFLLGLAEEYLGAPTQRQIC
jgi:CheY-like chemotaxis protein